MLLGFKTLGNAYASSWKVPSTGLTIMPARD